MTAIDRRGSAVRRPRPARPWLLLAGPVLALVVAACSTAAGAPAYTYAPPASPSASAVGGGDPSTSPMAMPAGPGPSDPISTPPASPAPASTGPDATASAAPIGATLHIAAQNIQFDTDHLAAPAGQGWVLEFDNNDAGVPHNVEIVDATGASVFKGEIVMGPTKVSYQVPALTAGTYRFLCDVHPTMTGTLTVG
jgi:plastocyanin